MTTIAFVGLGIMGAPMAANLVTARFDVIGLNRSQPAVDRHISAGGRTAPSLAEAVAGADVVATMLPDTPDVMSVLTGPDGVFAHARPGTMVLDFSTIRPDAAAQLAELGAAKSLRFLDAPVSGGEQGAIDGTLSIMVGGSSVDFELAQSVLDAIGTTVVHVGSAGSGQTVKAANQLIVGGTLALVAEALTFLEAHHVNTAAAVQVLRGGLAGSAVLDRKSGQMLQRSFDPGFRVELHHKDMGIVLDAARSSGCATPLGTLTGQLLAALVARGDGALDHTALFTLIGELSGARRQV
ncbi:NAD(P)-dependent oxidoreductase [Nocardioides sp. 616]|uniref:NAD(P)-dependent oxidoreductase n=1 Tax=Nocardioides sp. 616 TaxID=2268090 RepID=UPI000CE3FF2B|nr:NAD(P)-dependent oxidoreductase [Nocardioides sp. 616]